MNQPVVRRYRLSARTVDSHSTEQGSTPCSGTIFAGIVYRFRTLAFHVSKTGSIPVPSTIYGCVGKLVTPVDCKSAALWHYLFDSDHLHQIWPVSSVWPKAPPCHGGDHRFESGRRLWSIPWKSAFYLSLAVAMLRLSGV